MATNVSQEEKNLNEQYQNISRQLQASPTAYARGADPSAGDLQKQLDLTQIQKQREKLSSDRLERRWYGNNAKETAVQQDESLLNRALTAISAPLYGTVGAVEAVLGKGSEKGLANIPANIKERGTFGDLLKQYGVPSLVAAPIGFGLDVMFDPLTWATAGTSALVPRVFTGIRKAGIEGAVEAAESGVLKHLTQAGRFIPGVKATEKYANLVQKTISASEKFDKLVGTSLEKELAAKAGQGVFGLPRFGDIVENKLKQFNWGDNLVQNFKYRNKDWFSMEKQADQLYLREIESGDFVTGKSREELLANVTERFRQSDEILDAERTIEEASKNMSRANLTPQGQTRLQTSNIINEGADLATRDASYARAANGEHAALRMGGEAVNDEVWRELVDKMKSYTDTKTGVQWYDDMMKRLENIKVGDQEVGRKFLEGYNKFISIFKISKIGLTPSAYTNAILGNPVMAHMYGINPISPGFFGSVKKAFGAIRGKPTETFIKDIVNDVGWQEVMTKYPGLFKKTFHFNPNFLLTRNVIDDAAMAFRDTLQEAGEASQAAFNRLPKDIQEIVGMRQELLNKSEISALVGGAVEEGVKRPGGIASEAVRAGQIPGGYAVPTTTSISSEIYKGTFRDFLNNLEKKGAEGNVFAKFFHSYLTKPMNKYEMIDQSYKLGLTHYLSNVGVTEAEVRKMRRFIDILPEDIALDKATNLYKLNPLKSMEISHDVYMNYLAMPAAVKVLRSMPFFGAPFASFMYGMTVKAGKTAVYNPAAFSRMEAFLQEFTGRPSPLERKAMDLPYYQWYKRSGMVKLEIWKDHPVYLNVANMIPYYTLNIFQPTERKYSSTLGSQLTSVLDKTPILKTPEGQVIFDYFVQPLILQESNPQGAFGQPLWPLDASLGEKVGYTARSAAESVVPGVAGFAGLVTPGSQAYPSYRWRQLSYATQGKNPLGITGSESATSRTLRALSSSLGFPVYNLDTKYVASDVKKNLKQ